jgi:hypothetical protein
MKRRSVLLACLVLAVALPVFANGEGEKSNKMVVGKGNCCVS